MEPNTNSASLSERLQLVSFQVGEEEYGLSIHVIREIIRHVIPTVMPGMPEGVEGMIDLRGLVIPVVDLRRKFGLEACEAGRDTRVVVVEHESGVTGFRVDQVSEVIRVERERLEPPPALALSGRQTFVTSVVKLPERLMMLLDVEALLAPSAEADLVPAV